MNPETKMMELTFERVIPAAAEEVFDAWLDPQIPGKPWYGAARLIFTPVVDGLFYILTSKNNAKGIPHYGRFIAIDRPGKIQHTFVSPFTSGFESIVTVSFKKKGQDTLLTLHHEGIPDDEKGRQHEPGWNYLLGIVLEHYAGKR